MELTWRSGTQRNPAEPGGGTRQRNPANPAEPGGNLAETWQNPAEKKYVEGGGGFGRVSASLGLLQRLARGRPVCVKFLFPSFCQAPAVSNARPVTTSHNLSVLFPKQLSAELSAQHCLPEGRRLLEQPCCEIKVRNQLVQSNARRWTLETFNRQLGRR